MTDEITKKELFERLVRLEAKLDSLSDSQVRTSKKFTNFVLLVIGLEVVNLVLNYVIIASHIKLEHLLK